jgi:hypothetical protein
VVVACLDGVAATVPRPEDPAILAARDNGSGRPPHDVHEVETAAGDQRERIRTMWCLTHQLTRPSDTAPSADGHGSPPRSG